jgi:hypothetical protein
MTDVFEPGEYVLHPTLRGVRGQVLCTEYDEVYVCWETGYEPYTRHHVADIKRVNMLDLLVEGREIQFKFRPP